MSNLDDHRLWRALADPTRRAVLDLLRDRPLTTGAIAQSFPDLTRFGVMKHLDLLEQAGLITVERRGRERFNHLNAVPLQQIAERWIGAFRQPLAASLTRLGALAATLEQETAAMTEPQLPPASLADLRYESVIKARPETVWRALTERTGDWWNRPFLIDHERGERLTLDARLGGALTEQWTGGGGAIWAIVDRFQPGSWMRLNGTVAMGGAVGATIDFRLEPVAEGTKVTVSHLAVGGMSADLAQRFKGGWHELIANRLARIAEEG